jgi:hypothetical protein
LLRRWQAIMLATGVLASANASAFGNLDTYTRPLLTLLAPDHGAIWRTGYLLALLLPVAAWVTMQRDQVAGGPFVAFAGSRTRSPASSNASASCAISTRAAAPCRLRWRPWCRCASATAVVRSPDIS